MNELVFKKDKTGLEFVGNFEKLYQVQSNPWGQDGEDKRLKEYYSISRDNLYLLTNLLGGSIAEVGCGLGYCLNHITKQREGKFVGYDISKTAIDKASKLFPTLKFKVLDIRKEAVKSDVIILNELLWYILKDLDKVFDNCKCKFLIINQSFLKKQSYGKDIIDGFKGLMSYILNKNYDIVYSHYFSKSSPLMNGVIICSKQSI